MFKALITNLDIYSTDFHLRINGQTKFKTFSGGFLSMFTLALLTFSILEFGKNFYLRKNPAIQSETSKFKQHPELINDVTMNSMIKESDSILEMKVSSKLYKNGLIFQINLENDIVPHRLLRICDFDSDFTTFCLKLSELDLINYDKLGNKVLKPFSINLVSCKNVEIDEMFGVQCFPSFMEDRLVSSYIYLSLTTVNLDRNLYGKPFFMDSINFTYLLTSTSPVSLSIKYSIFNIYDDKGWISSNPEIYNPLDFSTVISGETPLTTNALKFLLKIDPNESLVWVFRTYEKIQGLLARIGGFIKVIVLIFSTINNMIKSFSYDLFFIASTFKLTYHDDNKPNTIIDPFSYESRSITNRNNRRDKPQKKEKPPSNDPKDLVKNITRENIKGDFFWTYILSQIRILFGKTIKETDKAKNLKLYKVQSALEITQKKRGIDYILKKLNEFEIIQQMILNQSQILALSCIEKPEVGMGNISVYGSDTQIKYDSLLLMNEKERDEELVNYFVSRTACNEMDTTDYYLLNSMKDNIKDEVLRKCKGNDDDMTNISLSQSFSNDTSNIISNRSSINGTSNDKLPKISNKTY